MYNFFIDDMQLPVTPSKLNMVINNQNETITLMNEGEVNILKKPGLTDVEFEALLPNVRYPFGVYPNGFRSASAYLNKLEALKIGQAPFQLVINRMLPNGRLLFDTNLTVSIEDYDIVEDAEENGFDVVVKIRLKQYRPYGTKKLKISAPTPTKATKKATVEKQRPTTSKPSPKTHKVVKGDTLWAIAKRYLGNGAKYPELAKLNKISNPNLIYPGQVIKLG